ncbi:MAG: DnaJ domain-containing protein [Actinobacteria bacterium]|nr:DnaJ domain-containing protein [Actinomycetota bacterium]
MATDTYYEVLGVGADATQEEIHRAYKKLAQQVHPDKGGTNALFRTIREAYETLSDPDRRRQYDDRLKQPDSSATDESFHDDDYNFDAYSDEDSEEEDKYQRNYDDDYNFDAYSDEDSEEEDKYQRNYDDDYNFDAYSDEDSEEEDKYQRNYDDDYNFDAYSDEDSEEEDKYQRNYDDDYNFNAYSDGYSRYSTSGIGYYYGGKSITTRGKIMNAIYKRPYKGVFLMIPVIVLLGMPVTLIAMLMTNSPNLSQTINAFYEGLITVLFFTGFIMFFGEMAIRSTYRKDPGAFKFYKTAQLTKRESLNRFGQEIKYGVIIIVRVVLDLLMIIMTIASVIATIADRTTSSFSNNNGKRRRKNSSRNKRKRR